MYAVYDDVTRPVAEIAQLKSIFVTLCDVQPLPKCFFCRLFCFVFYYLPCLFCVFVVSRLIQVVRDTAPLALRDSRPMDARPSARLPRNPTLLTCPSACPTVHWHLTPAERKETRSCGRYLGVIHLFICLTPDTIRYDTIRYDRVQWDTIRYDTTRCAAIQWDTKRYDTMWCNTMGYAAIRCNAIQYGATQWDTLR